MLTDLTGHRREVLPFLLKTNLHRRAHCWGQGGLGSGKRIGGAGGAAPSGLPGGTLTMLQACAVPRSRPADPHLPPDGAAHGLLLVQLGSADAVAECFMAYLHPCSGSTPSVPILSGQMLDFPMAPTSFLMGCHLDYFEEVSKVSTHCRIQGAELRDFWEDAWELPKARGRRGLVAPRQALCAPLLALGVCSGPKARASQSDTTSQVFREVRHRS